MNVTVDAIDQCLPQTQCRQCGYPRCRDYAKALKQNQANINQCPPGGDITITLLADLLDKPEIPLDPSFGTHRPKQLATIIEDDCIGCKKCIDICPVDCIIGTTKMMHTIIATDCTGCELCIPVCPTDCIDLIDAIAYPETDHQSLWPDFSQEQVKAARQATEEKIDRLKTAEEASEQAPQPAQDRNQLRQHILAAVQRQKNK